MKTRILSALQCLALLFAGCQSPLRRELGNGVGSPDSALISLAKEHVRRDPRCATPLRVFPSLLDSPRLTRRGRLRRIEVRFRPTRKAGYKPGDGARLPEQCYIRVYMRPDGSVERTRVKYEPSWFASTISRLRKLRPTAETQELPRRTDDRSVTFLGEEGFFRLSGDEWIYFVSHWSHSSTEENVILAIDQDGELYVNVGGHVCPYLRLICAEGRELESVENFLRTTVPDGSEEYKWTRVDKETERTMSQQIDPGGARAARP